MPSSKEKILKNLQPSQIEIFSFGKNGSNTVRTHEGQKLNFKHKKNIYSIIGFFWGGPKTPQNDTAYGSLANFLTRVK